MIEILAVQPGLATDLIARTSSTPTVQAILQLSLAPVFMLAAIGAVLNVMNMRLIWIVDRVDRIEREADEGTEQGREKEELPALRRRQKYIELAVNFSTIAALLICLIVAVLFISAFIRPALGSLVAMMWIASMASVFVALFYFLRETRIATSSASDRRKLSRAISSKDKD